MGDPNLEIVGRFVQRFVRAEAEAALNDVAPDAELDWSNSDAPDSGSYTGHEAWRAFIGARDEALGEREFEFTELSAHEPDTVLVAGRMSERGRASGLDVAAQGAAVFTVHDPKIVRLKLYQTSEQARDAIRLADERQ
jgi:ketosteroid isomerase-like protein